MLQRDEVIPPIASLAVFRLDAPELARRVLDRFRPRNDLPRIADLRPDHRRRDAILVRRVADRESSLDAGMTVIGVAVVIRHHAHDILALHFGAERAADAAIGTRRGNAVLRLTFLDHRFLGQRRGRAGLHAGAAGNTFGIEE